MRQIDARRGSLLVPCLIIGAHVAPHVRIGHREPGAHQRRGAARRFDPQRRAENLYFRPVDLAIGESLGENLQIVAGRAQKNGAKRRGLSFRRGGGERVHRFGDRVLAGIVHADEGRGQSGFGRGAAQAIRHGLAEIVVGQQRRHWLASRVLHRRQQPVDLLRGRDPQGPDARTGLRLIVGEGEHRHTRLTRDRPDQSRLGGGQRPEDHARARGDRLTRRRGRAFRGAAGVLRLQHRGAGLRQGQLRRPQHRCAHIAKPAAEW